MPLMKLVMSLKGQYFFFRFIINIFFFLFQPVIVCSNKIQRIKKFYDWEFFCEQTVAYAFKVKLPKSLHIGKEHWEVALAELITPSQFLNIFESRSRIRDNHT